MIKIKRLLFEVCGICQNDCVFCSHSGMISAYKGYQLSIAELLRFIDYTKRSDYFIEQLSIHGIGEPLLWDYFNEGLKMLKESGVIGNINVTTNGLFLKKIDNEVMAYIDLLDISLYTNFKDFDLLQQMKHEYKEKINISRVLSFRAKQVRRYKNRIPCRCNCQGPMFVKDKIFPYCGPPAFDAAKLKGIDLLAQHDLCFDLKLNYLDAIEKGRSGNMELCNFCFSNSRIHLPYYPWGYSPSHRKLIRESWAVDIFCKFIPLSIRKRLKTAAEKVYA